MDKYSLYCGLGNILSFVILYTVYIIAVILLILLFFPICGYFEEKILSGFINLMIEKFLDK